MALCLCSIYWPLKLLFDFCLIDNIVNCQPLRVADEFLGAHIDVRACSFYARICAQFSTLASCEYLKNDATSSCGGCMGVCACCRECAKMFTEQISFIEKNSIFCDVHILSGDNINKGNEFSYWKF